MHSAPDGDFTFRCIDCDHPFEIDRANPPGDGEMIRCTGCGRTMGTYAAVKAALIEQAKADVEAQLRVWLGEASS